MSGGDEPARHSGAPRNGRVLLLWVVVRRRIGVRRRVEAHVGAEVVAAPAREARDELPGPSRRCAPGGEGAERPAKLPAREPGRALPGRDGTCDQARMEIEFHEFPLTLRIPSSAFIVPTPPATVTQLTVEQHFGIPPGICRNMIREGLFPARKIGRLFFAAYDDVKLAVTKGAIGTHSRLATLGSFEEPKAEEVAEEVVGYLTPSNAVGAKRERRQATADDAWDLIRAYGEKLADGSPNPKHDAALGASNLTYAEASYTQRSPDWIASHVRAFEYFGGVPAALVPDQLKSGVSHGCRYEPEAQRTYEELARHYGTTVLPARPLHPRDKAKVEVAVQIAQRWLLARIRDEVFHSIGALNARLRELLGDLNGRVMRRYGKSRRALFEEIERAALRPLPASRFEYADWQKARVNIDYHVQVDGHLYSVPFRLVHEEVEARLTADVVEILHGRVRVASHRRSSVRGGFTTITEHMPSAHRAHAEWTPSRILTWAGKVGEGTRELCDASRTFPRASSASSSASAFRCSGIKYLDRPCGRLPSGRASETAQQRCGESALATDHTMVSPILRFAAKSVERPASRLAAAE